MNLFMFCSSFSRVALRNIYFRKQQLYSAYDEPLSYSFRVSFYFMNELAWIEPKKESSILP